MPAQCKGSFIAFELWESKFKLFLPKKAITQKETTSAEKVYTCFEDYL